jgi:uncharacterized membrane protein
VNVNVFATFGGLPLHPLVVHGPVVFIPLLVLLALLYALVPRLRGRIGWLTVIMAFVAPLSALAAKITGDAFRARIAQLSPHARFDLIDGHRHLGTLTLYFTTALALLVLAMVLIRNKPRVLNIVLIVLVVVMSAVSAYYVWRTGDAAARIVWPGYA